MENDTWLSRTPVVVLLTLVCALLWGSAFPVLKTGYGLLQITESTAGKLILPAGDSCSPGRCCRFTGIC